MAISTDRTDVIRVTRKGRAIIPEAIQEKSDIDAPCEVLVYDEDGRIVLEPVPSSQELQGIHDAECDSTELLERVRELRSDAT